MGSYLDSWRICGKEKDVQDGGPLYIPYQKIVKTNIPISCYLFHLPPHSPPPPPTPPKKEKKKKKKASATQFS